MTDYLILFIESYDVFIYSMNAIAAFLFGIAVFQLDKAFGITKESNIQEVTGSWSLVVCLIFCVITYASSFLIHGSIAGFFSDMYRFDMGEFSAKNEDCNPAFPDQYFHNCVRAGGFSLTVLAWVAMLSCLIATLSMVIWMFFTIKLKKCASK